jgi:hypothetical protein
MTKKKRRVITAMVSTAILSVGITATISYASYDNFEFELSQNTVGYSSSIVYDSSNSYVNVVPTAGIVNSAPMTLTVYNGTHTTAYSNPAYFTSFDPRNIYFTSTPSYYSQICLRGKAGYYYSRLKGIWQV